MGVGASVPEQREGDRRADQLASAYDDVAAVLEEVDLADEPRLADETIAALEALDRAQAVAADGEMGENT